jgi:hypothetical protein
MCLYWFSLTGLPGFCTLACVYFPVTVNNLKPLCTSSTWRWNSVTSKCTSIFTVLKMYTVNMIPIHFLKFWVSTFLKHFVFYLVNLCWIIKVNVFNLICLVWISAEVCLPPVCPRLRLHSQPLPWIHSYLCLCFVINCHELFPFPVINILSITFF